MLRSLLPSMMLALALPGCLWDFEFFEDVSEAGPLAPAVDRGVAPGEDSGPTPDAGPPARLSGPGPTCGSMCPALAIDGGQVVALAPNDRRALWIVAAGGPQALRVGGASQAIERPDAASHLIRVNGDSLEPQAVVPLPFQATSAAAVGNAVYVAGVDATAGELGGQAFEPGARTAVLVKFVNDQPQWWLSWQGRVAFVARGGNAVWLVGGPGNAELYLNNQPDPVQPSAADPNAPTTFIADLDGAGAVRAFQPFGGPQTTVERVAGEGALALAGLAPGAFTTWDGGTVPLGRFLAVMDPDLGLRWAAAWPFAGSVELTALAVTLPGEVWFAGKPAGPQAELGPLPAQCAEGPFVARARPNGAVMEAAVLAVDGARPQPGSAIHALAANEGAPVSALLQTYGPRGARTGFGDRELDQVGLLLSALNGNARATWTQHLGVASPNAPRPRHAVSQGGVHFAAVDIHGPLSWGERAPAPADQTTVILRYSP